MSNWQKATTKMWRGIIYGLMGLDDI